MQFLWPDTAGERDGFVISRRGERPVHDPWHPHQVVVEDERAADGSVIQVATIFLTGRECPWRCAMCDLWRQATADDTPPGAIPAQIAAALKEARHPAPTNGPHGAMTGRTASRRFPMTVKLYNAANFFDPRAVPESDYDRIAEQLTGLDRVIVESHPALIGPRVDAFMQALDEADESRGASPALEVAMGLETAHPEALERLNKRMTVSSFRQAAAALEVRGVALRVFLLLNPPFVPASEQDDWLFRSLETAVQCGATAISLIPTRTGNGTMEALATAGLFTPPHLDDIDRAATLAMGHVAHRARVFVDLWDLDRFDACPVCRAARHERLRNMNLQQMLLDPIDCDSCR